MKKQTTQEARDTMTTALLVDIKLALRKSTLMMLAPHIADIKESLDLFDYESIIDDPEAVRRTATLIISSAQAIINEVK